MCHWLSVMVCGPIRIELGEQSSVFGAVES